MKKTHFIFFSVCVVYYIQKIHFNLGAIVSKCYVINLPTFNRNITN